MIKTSCATMKSGFPMFSIYKNVSSTLITVHVMHLFMKTVEESQIIFLISHCCTHAKKSYEDLQASLSRDQTGRDEL